MSAFRLAIRRGLLRWRGGAEWHNVTSTISPREVAVGCGSQHFYQFDHVQLCRRFTLSSRKCHVDERAESNGSGGLVDALVYEKRANETLETLCEQMERMIDAVVEANGDSDDARDMDASYSNGVLNVRLGATNGTYVLNKQTPNRQIWLSSPISGPKRFDLDVSRDQWIYRRTGESLIGLLGAELASLFAHVPALKDFTLTDHKNTR